MNPDFDGRLRIVGAGLALLLLILALCGAFSIADGAVLSGSMK